MRPIQTAFATLSLGAFGFVAGTACAADPASQPAAAQPTAPAAPVATAAPEPEQSVVKTKTKSNQSND